MPIRLERQGNTGPVILLLLVLAVAVGLVAIALNDFCPDGFVRECVDALSGYLYGVACECVPISTVP